MKCAFCASVCAIVIGAASIMPVFAGEADSSSRQIQSVEKFNGLLNAGEYAQAEALAKESFLKNSSDPLAVMMLRHVFLTRSGQQIVFPATVTKSRVITPASGGQAASCGPTENVQNGGVSALLTGSRVITPATCEAPSSVQQRAVAGAVQGLVIQFNPELTGASNAQKYWQRAQYYRGRTKPAAEAVYCETIVKEFPNTEFSRLAQERLKVLGSEYWTGLVPEFPDQSQQQTRVELRGPLNLEIGLGINNQLVASAIKTCSGGCLEPLNAACAVQHAGIASAPASEKNSQRQLTTVPAPPVGRIQFQIKGFVNEGLLSSYNVPLIVASAGYGESNFHSDDEAGISMHLIKGPVSTLDRLGIAIQSETAQHISQHKLNAAKDALPTPITVPVLPQATDVNHDRAESLHPLTTHSTSHADVSTPLCAKREKIVRHSGESLATRRLSLEERQEILKVAQAAPRVSVANLPRLALPNEQGTELSNSVIDSSGKILALGIHSHLTPDQKAVLLRLSFHSEQGPAALTQRISLSEFLESEEALLIALDAPLGAPGLGVANEERLITYLVVSPKLAVPSSNKVAIRDGGDDVVLVKRPKNLKRVSAERKVGEQFEAAQERRVYPVADLVIPIPAHVGIGAGADTTPATKKADFKTLINTITSSIATTEWDEVGGPSSIKPFDTTLSLVIRATPAVHEQISELLRKLRKELDIQSVVELKVISGSPKSLADAGIIVSPQDVLLSRAELESRMGSEFAGLNGLSVTSEICPISGIERKGIDFDFDLSSKDGFILNGQRVVAISDLTGETECNMCEAQCPLESWLQFGANCAQSVHPLMAALIFGPPSIEFGEETSCCQEDDTLPVKLLTTAQREFLTKEVQSRPECNVMYAPKVTMFNGQTASVGFDKDLSVTVKVKIGADRRCMATMMSVTNNRSGKESQVSKSFDGRLVDGESILFRLPGDESNPSGKPGALSTYLILTPRVIIMDEEVEVKSSDRKSSKATDKMPLEGGAFSFYTGFTR